MTHYLLPLYEDPGNIDQQVGSKGTRVRGEAHLTWVDTISTSCDSGGPSYRRLAGMGGAMGA